MGTGGAPLVGVPCYSGERAGSGRPFYGNNQSYVRALIGAGLAPLLIPPMDEAALEAVCARLDGLLLSGGEDVDPAFYGEERLPECQAPDRERDAMELALARMALARDLPVLGICRGIQTLNVARGGTLYQDLGTQLPETHPHAMSHLPRATLTHEIVVERGSHLAEILGVERLGVNSLHHQAVREPGTGLKVVALADDGVVEAMEATDRRFVVAVQYHPEELIETDELSRKLFAAFARSCQEA
jgi:putative glutamine amidotransferase